MNPAPQSPLRKPEVIITLIILVIGIVWLITPNPRYEPLTVILMAATALLGVRSQP